MQRNLNSFCLLLILITVWCCAEETRLSGKVEDMQLQPVAGAEVQLKTVSAGEQSATVTTVKTDADGKFDLQFTRPAGDQLLELTVAKAGRETFTAQMWSHAVEQDYRVTLRKRYDNPLQGFFKGIGDEVTRSLLLAFTDHERKLFEAHPQWFAAAKAQPEQSSEARARDVLQACCEWIAGDRGEVDSSEPMSVQVISFTHFNHPEIQPEFSLEFPAKRGGFNQVFWNRFEKGDAVDRLSATGYFQFTNRLKQTGRVKATVVAEYRDGKWQTVDQELEWLNAEK
ncbi:carboxypeptidase-like regulatory domain-containing protein [Gimesia panareensis]|uniref:carboxypeptidase-like regulatory domain-containing protein n=1 Tax=Gimesia panareensis TaxID=2527978 RepID=UPI00118A9A80|nr:carboxypeptidase-like regulatory domain-containing protein [Gimesia panareensis]QDU53685.1 hypothetical protein Pan110_60790 [Gimesia panareensis]